LISALFRENFAIGIGVMLAITLIVMSMVYELFVMRDLPQKYAADSDVEDISEKKTIFFLVVILLLLLSFFNPLWFVF
jgi:Na+/H+ antiporter NhaD/arsenite permease-like protein